MIPDGEMRFPPATAQEYRGINYVLAAMVIGRSPAARTGARSKNASCVRWSSRTPLPAPLLEEMFTVPPVSTMDGRPASYGAGLQTFTINGITVWGKTGEQYGYNAGMFSTRDQQRRLTYSFTPTVRDSSQQQMTLRIANAVTAP